MIFCIAFNSGIQKKKGCDCKGLRGKEEARPGLLCTVNCKKFSENRGKPPEPN